MFVAASAAAPVSILVCAAALAAASLCKSQFVRQAENASGGFLSFLTKARPIVARWRSARREARSPKRGRLPINPFLKPSDQPEIERGIEAAAAACVRLSSTCGLIYFEISCTDDGDCCLSSAMARDEIAAAAHDMLVLEPCDSIIAIGRGGMLACILLLENAADLGPIAGRLAILVRGLGFCGRDGPEPGISVYPADGYTGAELIDAAKLDYGCARAYRFSPRMFNRRVQPLFGPLAPKQDDLTARSFAGRAAFEREALHDT